MDGNKKILGNDVLKDLIITQQYYLVTCTVLAL